MSFRQLGVALGLAACSLATAVGCGHHRGHCAGGSCAAPGYATGGSGTYGTTTYPPAGGGGTAPPAMQGSGTR